MYNKKLPAISLAPLSELKESVERFAARCEPDYVCKMPELRQQMTFTVIETALSETKEAVACTLEGAPYMFSDYARNRLLELLGCKEKWFGRVTLEDQARELNRRVHVLSGKSLRRMQSLEGVGFVRGIVSHKYQDIPNKEIITALCEVMPEGEHLATYSGTSDTNFYVFAMLRDKPLGIDKHFTGYPGVAVKNSEVGANALTVVPFFVSVTMSGRLVPVAIRDSALLRVIHRGEVGDLRGLFLAALSDVQGVWAPLHDKLRALAGHRFATQEEAIERLEKVLHSMRVTQSFVHQATTTYCAAQHRTHHGLALFTAVLEVCAQTRLDSRYDDAAVAGSVLLHLL